MSRLERGPIECDRHLHGLEPRTTRILRVEELKLGRKRAPKLNIGGIPMKRTLKRELKVLEIAQR